MSVVGIDFGSLNTVVAVARNKGIDVIVNEVSNRATPSLVSFGQKQRFLGESAKTQETSNFKNTVAGLKRLVGRSMTDPDVEIERKYINANLVPIGDNEETGVSVNFLYEQSEFSYTQLVAMFLGKVRSFTATEIGVPLTDAVISIPGWFSTHQRQALIDAANISGINVLSLINDITSSALGYGLTKTDLPDPANYDKPRNVVLVDFGYSSLQVGVVAFQKGKFEVKATSYDRNLGGRSFDDAMLDHYVKEFDAKYKLDIRSSKKAIHRLRAGCEKAKKILSANTVTMLNVECLLDDKDVSAQVQRADFEEWIKPLIERVKAPIEEVLKLSGIPIKDIHSVELVGGTTRIPLVKEVFSNYFGADKLATTLNQDEAVSRGAALKCAMISPIFKVRDIVSKDWNDYPIEVSWDASLVPAVEGKEPKSKIEAFPLGNQIPCTRNLTLTRILDDAELSAQGGSVGVELDVHYTEVAAQRNLPATGMDIGKWRISGIKRVYTEGNIPEGGEVKATIKARITANDGQIISVDSAIQISESTITEKIPVEKKTKEGEEIKPEDIEYTTKTKKVTHEHPLTVERHGAEEHFAKVALLLESEGKMAAADRLAIDTAEKRNTLEEYVYDSRNKLDTTWAEYCDDSTKAKFKDALNAMEEWLYTEEGEEATRDKYHTQLMTLKKIGDPIAQKLFEYEESVRIAHEKEVAAAKAKAEAEAKAKAEAEAKAKAEAEAQADENANGAAAEKTSATPSTGDDAMDVE